MTTGDGHGSRIGVDPPDRDGHDREGAPLRTAGRAGRPPDDRAGDRAAADAFAELRDRSEPADPDAVLEGSPESLVEDADGADDEPADRDDDLLDEDALEDLLLSGRTEAYGFRWIETPDAGDDDAESAADPLEGIEFGPDERDGSGSDVVPADEGWDPASDDETPAREDEPPGRADGSPDAENGDDTGDAESGDDADVGESDADENRRDADGNDDGAGEDADDADGNDDGAGRSVLSRVRSILGRSGGKR